MSKVRVLGLVLTAASMIGMAHAQQQTGSAIVANVRGTADYSQGDGTWSPLRVNQTLHSGAIVRTGMDSIVDLNLRQNGPVLRITPESTLALDTLLYERTGAGTVIETRLNLSAGRILGYVGRMSEASKYEVEIPSGVVGIRGTEYDISASGLTHTLEGELVMVYIFEGEQETHVIPAGNTFVPETRTVQPTSPDQANESRGIIDESRRIVLLGEREVRKVVIPEIPADVSPIKGTPESGGQFNGDNGSSSSNNGESPNGD